MSFELAVTLFGLVGTACAIVFGYAAFHRAGKKEVQDDGKESGTLLTEIGYIKSGVDDIKRKQDRQEEQHIDVIPFLVLVQWNIKW